MAKRGGFPGGMPGNMNNIMKQAQKMQKQMEEAQAELEASEYTATAGGGAVEVTISGSKEITKMKQFEKWMRCPHKKCQKSQEDWEDYSNLFVIT